jgi:hypothetical protein
LGSPVAAALAAEEPAVPAAVELEDPPQAASARAVVEMPIALRKFRREIRFIVVSPSCPSYSCVRLHGSVSAVLLLYLV